MASETIEIAADGGNFKAYLARADNAAKAPGLVVIQEIFGVNQHIRAVCDRYAEEGYNAIAPDIFWRIKPGTELAYDDEGIREGRELAARCDGELALSDIAAALRYVRGMPGGSGKAAVIGFCFGGRMAFLSAARLDPDVAISYYGGGIERHAAEAAAIRCPIMFHWGAEDAAIPPSAREAVRSALAAHDHAESYVYSGAGHGFNCDRRASFHPFAASLAHSRTLGLLHSVIGPRYDLSELWERHTACEFSEHDADATMRTMVAEPYVNHIPTMTGGYGYKDLRDFYAAHFIPRLPADTKVTPLTRTIGPDRLVDEFILSFTHDREIDFMIPGIAPTGRYVEVPHVAVVQFRGGKIAHEHIHWDQASLLKQLGVLDADGLPIAGIEGARKFVNPALGANEMIARAKARRRE
jgi:carboxymethylenebutenolidase